MEMSDDEIEETTETKETEESGKDISALFYLTSTYKGDILKPLTPSKLWAQIHQTGTHQKQLVRPCNFRWADYQPCGYRIFSGLHLAPTFHHNT